MADASNIVKAILFTVIMLVLMIVAALVFFIIVSFITNWVGDLVFGSDTWAKSYGLLSAAILSAGILIAAGKSKME